MFKNIAGAVAFLSRIPLKSNAEPKDCVRHFPFVGYISGGLLAVLLLAGRSLPMVAGDLFILYFLFNAFYFDGLIDTTDAFMSQRSREGKLRIMKLGNIGPMALLVGTLYIISKLHIVAAIPLWGVVASSVSSKYAIVVAAAISRPAKNDGLGALIMPIKINSLLWSSVYLVPFLFFPKSLIPLSAAILAGIVVVWISHKMISGITGDVFGAIEEISELFAMAAVLYWCS